MLLLVSLSACDQSNENHTCEAVYAEVADDAAVGGVSLDDVRAVFLEPLVYDVTWDTAELGADVETEDVLTLTLTPIEGSARSTTFPAAGCLGQPDELLRVTLAGTRVFESGIVTEPAGEFGVYVTGATPEGVELGVDQRSTLPEASLLPAVVEAVRPTGSDPGPLERTTLYLDHTLAAPELSVETLYAYASTGIYGKATLRVDAE